MIVVSQSGNDSGGPADEGLLNGLAQDGTSLGDPKASHTLVEYGDMQCPFCAEYDRNVLPTVIENYVRPGALRLEFRPLTFIGPDSEKAARFALGLAAQNKFWNFVDLMYHDQQTENSGYVTDDYLRGLADQIPGADAEKAFAQSNSANVTQALNKAKSDAADAGVSSTPAFFIGPTGGQLAKLQVSQLEPGAFSDAIDAAIGG